MGNTLIFQNSSSANQSFLATTSSVKTPTGSNTYCQMTNGSVTLTAGSWILSGSVLWDSSGGSPGYTGSACGFLWAGGNGADTSSAPTTIASVATVDAGDVTLRQYSPISTGGEEKQTNLIRVTVTGNTPIYLIPYVNAVTTANARISTYILAQKVG